jgi:hypothetical protein
MGLNGLCVLATGALLTLSAAATGQDAADATAETDATDATPRTTAKTGTVTETVPTTQKVPGKLIKETTTVEITETFPAPYLGEKDTWVVGADRVAGYGWSKQIADGFSKSSGSTFNVFGKTTTAVEGSILSTAIIPLEGPRLTIDGFPVDRLSLGGTLMFNFETASSGIDGAKDASATAFGIEFRVGYAIELSDLIAFWPKVGIQWGYAFIGDSDVRATNLDLHFDLPLVFSITNQAALTLTPAVALPLLAQTKNLPLETPDEFVDGPKFLQVAASLGLITWF